MRNCGWLGRLASPGVLLCLSALVVLLLAVTSSTSAAVGVTFTVDSTGDGADANVSDGVCADATGACTLRAAIEESNASVGFKDTIGFNLPTSPFSIEPTTALPAITDPVEINGTLQPGFVDEPIVELRGPSGSILNGLRLLTGNSTVRGLVINRFNVQISIEPPAGGGNRIAGNFLGTDVTGMAAADSSYAGGSGISINGASDVLIGGSGASDRNVISGSRDGIDIFGGFDGVSRITIKGNYIGTDATGEAALAGIPVGGSNYGVLAQHTETLNVGGDGPGEGNVISGNALAGVSLGSVSGNNTVGSGARIVGNKIGTDVDGETAVPNGAAGVHADVDISDVLIARNVISGNGFGLDLHRTERTVIQGNMIGVDGDGLEPIPNGAGAANFSIGVNLTDAVDALIGGTTEAERNIISGNNGVGVLVAWGGADGSFPGSYTRNRIEGNLIGVGADGRALGNVLNGVVCYGCGLGNVIGGLAEGAGNVIAYNGEGGDHGLDSHGVHISGPGCVEGPHAAILGNSIHSNGALGIDVQSCVDFGPTPNDLSPPCASPPGPDCDMGPNDVQNFPVIRDVTNSGGQTVAEVEFDSIPNEEFRLEFFRNDSCNETEPASTFFTGFFGEGQALVGVKEVPTDAAGNWSGTVTLAGETDATQVITATATRFTESAPSLVGSTSEFSECLADLAITKADDPDPVLAGASLTYKLDVTNEGPAPANNVQVVDTLPASLTVTSITPSQGSCSHNGPTITCDLGLVARDGTAEISIVVDPGSEPREFTNTAEVSSELRDPDEADNSASETTRVVTGGTIVIAKQTLPAGSSQSFAFTTSYGPGFSLSDGQSNTSGLLAPGSYSVSETAVPGWDLESAVCSDESPAVAISLEAGEVVTCVFTNEKDARIVVEKQTLPNGDPRVFSFDASYNADGFALSDGQSNDSGDLDPGTYSVSENVPAGWDLLSVVCSDESPRTAISLQAGEVVTCVFTNEKDARIVVEKQTLPNGDPQLFSFTATYDADGFALSDGQSNDSGDLDPGTYAVSETAVPGWDLTSATCDDGSPISTIDVGPGETVTCTFINTQRGSVTLRKTTNGVVDPSKDILFILTGPGLPPAGISRSTFGDQDGILEFGSGNLIPAQTYTICETPVPAGFTSFWKLDGVIVSPYNPDASRTPPEDLGTRCYGFSVSPGQARAFEVDNSHPGGDPRTIGYWKNWNRCTGGNQSATAQKNGGAAAGFFLVEDLLPQTIGDFAVTSCQRAVKLLSKQDQAGRNKASDAAYELASQLLAALFNLAAGAETCATVQQAVLGGQTLLDGINFSGSGDYLGSKSKDPKRAQALALAATLDRYNNGNLC